MGLFGIDSNKTSARDERIAVTDQGVATRGGNTTLGEEVLALGTNARLQAGGIQVAGGGKGSTTTTNITTSDPDVLREALEFADRQSSGFTDTLQDLLNAQGSQTQGILDAVLGQLASLAESKQTEGESGRDKIIMWIALGLFAVVAIFFWRRR